MTTDTHSTASHPDTALIDWLQNLQIDDISIDRVSISCILK